jgi:geranylgeranyl transferase type-2 subunit alpha
MLQADERNFHAWNYRALVVDTQIKALSERPDAQIAFIKEECELADKIISKNFSNYSAWDFRSKMLPLIYAKQEGIYAFPLA